MKRMQVDVPELAGWCSIQEAADRLGISRQAVWSRLSRGDFPSARRVGEMYVLLESEVEKLAVFLSVPSAEDEA